MSEKQTLEDVLQSSGRLRHEDGALLARALLVLLSNRAAYPADAEEALVQVVASLAVIDGRKGG